jgi:hypothetical protein
VTAVTNILAFGIRKFASLRLPANQSQFSNVLINGKTTSLTKENISSAGIWIQKLRLRLLFGYVFQFISKSHEKIDL